MRERIDTEAREGTDGWLIGAHVLFAVVGVLSAAALGYGLWTSRHLPFVPDIGTLLAHRGVGNYSLSMSHLFDLTGPSFAALRLPAVIAALVLLVGPLLALRIAPQGAALRSNLICSLHDCDISHRCAHRICALRPDALL